MSNLDALVEEAKKSELFTTPQLADDMRRFLDQHRPAALALAAEARERGIKTVFFTGSGGSWSAMYSGKYFADRFTTLTTDAQLSYELIWRNPQRLGPDSLVFAASYSGETEDTVAALRFAKEAGAWTVGLVNKPDSTIATEADTAIAYESSALYAMPMAAVSLFALEWGRLDGNEEAEEVLAAFDALPDIIAKAFENCREPSLEIARALLPAQELYCVAAGPLYGLAYKFALTVFMENIRTHGSVIESAEFRHGPAEMLERQRPTMVFLLGTDESREMTQRSIDVAEANGAQVVVYDVADYPGLHPLLAPFVMKVPLQWMVVHSALLRGILDLDDRVFMGRNVLSKGGARWP
ncbi:MAG: SIS domain-containing protein [Solirubrobacterales bacterium]|nr:SIS domain-containing protein [Solirubrobacterales bacterium]